MKRIHEGKKQVWMGLSVVMKTTKSISLEQALEIAAEKPICFISERRVYWKDCTLNSRLRERSDSYLFLNHLTNEEAYLCKKELFYLMESCSFYQSYSWEDFYSIDLPNLIKVLNTPPHAA